MKIGVIGFGYWGKIIVNNLINLGYKDIIICDSQIDSIMNQNLTKKFKFVKDYKNIGCDKVFIVTPTKTHFKIVSYFLKKGMDVFCEKPLTINYEETEKLYELSKNYNAKLFVDWVFTFNSQMMRLKYIIDKNNLKCKNIIMNRMNFGPERFDVNSTYDLSSHDVSIVSYLFEKNPESIKWFNFKRDKDSIQDDSSIGILLYDDFTVQINSSWFYGEKYRKCFFEFEEGYIYWDDIKKDIKIDFKVEKDIVEDDISPLELSIKTFLLSRFDVEKQKKLTLTTQKIISSNDQI